VAALATVVLAAPALAAPAPTAPAPTAPAPTAPAPTAPAPTAPARAAAPAPAASPAAPRRDHEGNLLTADGQPVHANKLILEASPYLQQHAHNPVQWLPWGEEAFRKARAENKPIFLSIGYSTCHWCHVMARESFSDEEVAALLNLWFVPVKVDREERPDVDDVYMTATHVMGRRGGWPLSAWLTPELEPFESGTYYPKDRFTEVLTSVAAAWSGDAAAIRQRGARVAAAVRQQLSERRASEDVGAEVLAGAVSRLGAGFDEVHGGWGLPKFPRESAILYLLDHWQVRGGPRALDMALRALDAMQGGGIHDQVGGGFHRYSVDARWLVPHFEKMLYNQAWLARAYLEAWRLTGDDRYRRTVEGILGYVERDLTAEGGAFFSAEDADSEGEEGLFYVFRPEEIKAALGQDEGALAAEWLGVSGGGNFRDVPGASILTARGDPEAFARAHGMTPAAFEARLARWNARLVEIRARRVRPHLDDKILTDWNGFMIGTLARAGAVLAEPRHVKAAERAARFLLARLVDEDGRLLHAWRGRPLPVPAFLDDHAALVDALIELADATMDDAWLEEARRLHATMREQFRDDADGAFARTGPRHETLLARSKDGHDGAVPSGNALAAWDAVRLWRRTGDAQHERDAEAVFGAFAGELRQASGAAFMLRALLAWQDGEAGWQARDESGVVSVRGPPGPVRVAAGEEAVIPLELGLRAGWHVGSGDPGGVVRPTTVSVREPARSSAVSYPSGRETALPFSDEKVRLYAGGERLEVRLAAGLPAGPFVARIDVGVQACDDSKCLAPATLRLEVPLVIGPPAP
jgi:hypothetical protein